MKVRTGKDEEEKIDERVQQGRVLETDRYKISTNSYEYRRIHKRKNTRDGAERKQNNTVKQSGVNRRNIGEVKAN